MAQVLFAWKCCWFKLRCNHFYHCSPISELYSFQLESMRFCMKVKDFPTQISQEVQGGHVDLPQTLFSFSFFFFFVLISGMVKLLKFSKAKQIYHYFNRVDEWSTTNTKIVTNLRDQLNPLQNLRGDRIYTKFQIAWIPFEMAELFTL